MLLSHIRNGFWRVGEKIPSELELSAELGVAKLTIHRAVQALARDGWVTRGVGKGTFVADRSTLPALRRVVLTFGSSPSDVLASDYYGSLYRGIATELGPEVELILSPAPFGSTPLPSADGILLIAPRPESHPYLEELAKQELPTVVLGASWSGMPLPCIDSDNRLAARQAVEHLASLGHRKLALLYAEPETANVADRLTGFREAVVQMGRSATEHQARQAWELQSDERAKLLATLRSGATAIFAAGYYLSLEALNTLREAQYCVPDDVSLIAFDDPVSARLVYPPLTTFRQPLVEMGQRAAQRLRNAITQHDRGGTEHLPISLIPRDSTRVIKTV